MSKMKKLINEKKVTFVYACDKPSLGHNTPTPESVVVTIAYSKVDGTFGFAVKLPGDQPIPRIGKAIALRNMSGFNYIPTEHIGESTILFDFFKVKSGSKKSFTPEVRDRIKYIFGDNKVGMLTEAE